MSRLTPDSSAWQVPEFTVDELGPKRSRYCLCVFVINEGERVRRQLKRMRPYSGQVDVLVCDGGSTDSSLDLDFLRGQGVRALLTKNGSGKLSAQIRMGMAYAIQQGYEGIIVMDGNDKDDPEAISRFVAALDDGVDHVQGSRFIKGGHHANTPFERLVAVRMLHAPLISLGARFCYTDTTNGFRAYSRKFLLDTRVQPFRDVFETYELHYYLAVRAPRLGFIAREIPVSRVYPSDRSVPTKIGSFRQKLDLLLLVLRSVIGSYDPKIK